MIAYVLVHVRVSNEQWIHCMYDYHTFAFPSVHLRLLDVGLLVHWWLVAGE